MRISSTSSTRNSTNSSINPLKSRREVGVDIWRGIAVVSMIITHAIAFFHVGYDPVVSSIGIYGGIISFTLFLFLSGISSYFAFIKYDGAKHSTQIERKRKKIVFRTLFILLGYYLVAIVAVIPNLSFPLNGDSFSLIGKILTLQYSPQFTEFILAFVVFNITLLLIRPIYKFWVRFPLLLLAVGGGLFAIGQILYQIDVPLELSGYKALLVGHEDIHSFPLLQYFIVFALGMSFGKFLFETQKLSTRKRVALFATFGSILLSTAAIITSSYFNLEWLDPMHRWPPSIGFILIGLASAYTIWLILIYTANLKILGPIQVFIHYMGTKAFDFFVFHTIILFIYAMITGEQRHDSPIVVALLFFALIGLTFFVTSIVEGIIQGLRESAEDSDSDSYGWLFTERVAVNFVWILVISLVGLSVFQGQVQANPIDPNSVSFKKRLLREEEWPFWWDNSFTAFRQVSICNQTGFTLETGKWYQINLNHTQLIKARKSTKSAEDFRVVYYNELEDEFFEVPFIVKGKNTNNAQVIFSLATQIPPGQSNDKYFVYYGNPDIPGAGTPNKVPASGSTECVNVSDEYTHQLNGAVNKKWHLKEGISELQLKTMRYTVNLNKGLSPESVVTFNVIGTDIRGVMDNLGGGKYRADVPVGGLEPGVYKVQSTAREPENKLKLITSGQTTFFVSYPLYVVWTMDWEGSKFPYQWLDIIDRIARRYKMPMTHFFNPRIFVRNEISKDLADRYTLWVQERAKNFNDDIGLHLHMWTDMVAAAGVTPRYSPVAPWLGGAGYGTLTSAYSKAEMKKILNWSKRIFQDNGLLAPTSYRAGGWFAAEHTLEALAETGFLIDSSGRTLPSDARQKAYPPPWNLKPTTRPYKPSKKNQNVEGTPSIDIWEFPNNGADSYWYGTKAMIDRFRANYPRRGEILYKPQVVNYLSHPNFFIVYDDKRMPQVFNYISKFLERDDNGPVKYSTLDNAYYGYIPWAEEQKKIN